jgi:hypothetical protein
LYIFVCGQGYGYWLVRISRWTIIYVYCYWFLFIYPTHGCRFASSIPIDIFEFKRETSISSKSVIGTSSIICYCHSCFIKIDCRCHISTCCSTRRINNASSYRICIDSCDYYSGVSAIPYKVVECYCFCCVRRVGFCVLCANYLYPS